MATAAVATAASRRPLGGVPAPRALVFAHAVASPCVPALFLCRSSGGESSSSGGGRAGGRIRGGGWAGGRIHGTGAHKQPVFLALNEHVRTEGQLDRMHQLLEELSDSTSWFEGCGRVLLYCVQHNYSDAAIDLLKQLKEKDEMSTYMVVDQVFGQIWDVEPTNLDLGMELLHAVKELGLNVSRTSLDFLLSACVKAKDSQRAQQIWTEYEAAGLPHNVLTSLRMYQALLSSGRRKAAKKLLKTISKEDDHVRYIIDSCHMTYYIEGFKKSSATVRSSKERASSK